MKTKLQGYFIAGLFTFLPLLVTYFVLRLLFYLLEASVGPLGRGILVSLLPAPLFGAFLKYHVMTLLGLLLTTCMLILLGYLSTSLFGKRVLIRMDQGLSKIPVLGNVYHAAKQLTETVGTGKKSFREVVLVEFPRKGVFALGFVTHESTIERGHQRKKVYHVFVPTNHMYLGYTIFLTRAEMMPIELSVQDGIKLVMSGGIVSPEVLKKKKA